MIHCSHRSNNTPGAITKTVAMITDMMIHEIDVMKWLTGEGYAFVQLLIPKSTKYAVLNIKDPLYAIFETSSGIIIDVEASGSSQFGYEIKCEALFEEGIACLPLMSNCEVSYEQNRSIKIPAVWTERFEQAYDIEIQSWINASKRGEVINPNAWDAYVAAITMNACIKALETGEKEQIILDSKPSLYSK